MASNHKFLSRDLALRVFSAPRHYRHDEPRAVGIPQAATGANGITTARDFRAHFRRQADSRAELEAFRHARMEQMDGRLWR